MLQKLESEIRNHIRIEQQMKIAMETLSQKLDDKDKERNKIRVEYKQYILELKQDKKRYEELLELRDKELENFSKKLKKQEESERCY